MGWKIRGRGKGRGRGKRNDEGEGWTEIYNRAKRRGDALPERGGIKPRRGNQDHFIRK